ncbi:MAG TPA: fibronectin type III domain-containing protein [Acidimicrobiales bacterium]|nr:fibronectin type III domain-containing protein [Acidimicrobiales bacterium]
MTVPRYAWRRARRSHPRSTHGAAPRLGSVGVLVAMTAAFAPIASASADPVAVDRTTFKDATGTATTSGFDTTGPNELLVAFAASQGPPGQTVAVSGAGLTWSLARRANTQSGTAEAWTAFAPAKLTNAKVTSTQGTAGYYQSLTVVTFTGASGIGATAGASAATGAPSVALTSTAAGSWSFAVGVDTDRALARTLGPNQSMVHQAVKRGAGTFWTQSTTGSTAATGTVVTLNDTAPTTDRFNLAAVEVLPAAPSTAPVVISAVTATNVTSSGASIAWTTDRPATSQVEYGTTTAYGSVTSADATLVTNHSQMLGGLQPGTQYHYRVTSADASATSTTSPDGTFVTASTGAAPLAIDRSAYKDASGTVTTAPFDTSGPNELLVAFVSSDGPAGMTASVSGSGLGWSLARRTNTQLGTSEVWSAFAPNKLTAATVTSTPSSAGYVQSLTVLAFSGAAGIGATSGANAPSGAPAVSLTTTAAGSWAFAVGFDYDGAIARTLGAGQTMVHQAVQAGSGTFWAQSTSAPTATAGTLVTLNDTAPTNDRYNLAAVEVRSAAATAGPPTITAVTANNVSTTAATITWTTDQPGTSRVEYGPSTAYGSATVADSSLVTSHSQVVSGLQPGVQYHYRAISADWSGAAATSPDASFTTADAATVGDWSPAMNWPLVAIDSAVLHTGDVLVFDDEEYEPVTTARLWHPVTASFDDVPVASPIFCSGHAALADGRLLVAGGGAGESGARDVNIFDPTTKSWTRTADLNVPRWYPSVTLLSDGRALAISGQQTSGHWADTPEIYDPATGRWTLLTGVSTADIQEEEYPLSYLLPDGRVLVYGASTGRTRILDIAARTWTAGPTSPMVYGSAVMYRPGQLLVSGGAPYGASSQPGAAVLDLTAPSPTWRQVAPMAYGRYMHNLVVLADGRVLAVGGSTVVNTGSVTGVLPAELWNPVTETWTTMAAMGENRMYHSTAVLLPDGRVLAAGGGRLPPAVNHLSAQLYSPSYLAQPGRPTITGLPSAATYGSTIALDTPDASAIASVMLLSPASQTHSLDMGQHVNALPFTRRSGGLDVVVPSNANLAPPGWYMVVVKNASGVPSAARMVRLAASIDTAPTVISNVAAGIVTGSSATVTWTTDKPADSQVDYGTTSSYGASSPLDASLVTSHSRALAGLAPNTLYHYRVASRTGAGILSTSADMTFTTTAAAAPVATDRVVFRDASGPVTTAAFDTAGPNELLVAFVSSDGPSGQTATVTGGGLAWSLARRANAQPGTAEVWTAYAPAKLTGVTVTSTPASGGYFQSLTVVAFTGASGVGATAGASGTTAAPSVSLTTTAPGSWAFAVGFDYDRAVARTVGSGQTMVHEAVQSGAGTFWLQSTAAPTPSTGTAVTLYDTAPTNDRYNFTAVEVRAAA